MFKLDSIRSKLLLVMLISALGLLLLIGSALYTEKHTLRQDRMDKTRHLVESAVTVVAHFHDRQKSGELSEADAKKGAIDVLKAMRYDKAEYFWINDMHPTVVMHPIKPELDGTDVSSVKDADGKLLFIAFVDTVRAEGAGFVDYAWPKPGNTDPVPKLSYVKGFEPWGWVIGSGIYIDDVDRIFRQTALNLLMLSLVIAGLIGVILFLLVRSVTQHIAAIQLAIQDIDRTRDLSRRVQVEGNDELSEIGRSFNRLVENFQQLIHRVIDSSHQVREMTDRVSGSSERVTASSNQQSEASSSMAAALEETGSSIEQVASNSTIAQQMAESAGELSTQGERIVTNAATEMQLIATSVQESAMHIQALDEMSDQISSIVNVIKEIADQTNLLALNAAIEAARAGESGRGFAVVADEVRKLAERTAQSTVEITRMIDNIHTGTQKAVTSMNEGSARVQEGVELAKNAGNSMREIHAGSGKVIVAVSDIANALREQSAATQLVVENVERIVVMAEQNNVEVKEIEQSIHQLNQLSRTLEETVAAFKV